MGLFKTRDKNEKLLMRHITGIPTFPKNLQNKQLFIPDENKKFERIYIESLNDLYKYKNNSLKLSNDIYDQSRPYCQ